MPNADQDAPRVLIADDQPDVVEALRQLLKGEGYQTQTVFSPNGALKAMEAAEFELVLMDLNYTRDTTSGEEGLDLLSRLRALDDTLPVVVMTTSREERDVVASYELGANSYVQKPVGFEAFTEAVRFLGLYWLLLNVPPGK